MSRPQHTQQRVAACDALLPATQAGRDAALQRDVFPPLLRGAVEEYVHALQGMLRLGDWTVQLDWSTPADEDCYAQITPNENSRHAWLQLSPLFLGLPEDQQRQTLVHELLHCHVFDLHHCAELMLENCASRSAFKVSSEVLNARVELLVDALADVLAPLCPSFAVPGPSVAGVAVPGQPADEVLGRLSVTLLSR